MFAGIRLLRSSLFFFIDQAHGFTKSAVEAIEAKGGKCELLSPTTNEVLSMEEDDE